MSKIAKFSASTRPKSNRLNKIAGQYKLDAAQHVGRIANFFYAQANVAG